MVWIVAGIIFLGMGYLLACGGAKPSVLNDVYSYRKRKSW